MALMWRCVERWCWGLFSLLILWPGNTFFIFLPIRVWFFWYFFFHSIRCDFVCWSGEEKSKSLWTAEIWQRVSRMLSMFARFHVWKGFFGFFFSLTSDWSWSTFHTDWLIYFLFFDDIKWMFFSLVEHFFRKSTFFQFQFQCELFRFCSCSSFHNVILHPFETRYTR